MINMDNEMIYIPSINKRLDKNEDCIAAIKEDVDTIKIGLGYKEKSNGAFRKEVEETDKNLIQRIQGVETEVTKISSSLTSMKWIMTIILPLISGLLIEILIKL